MKVVVDTNLCQGHARCWDICPEVFDLDEEGHATVTLDEVPPELAATARQAANNCPERAITVT